MSIDENILEQLLHEEEGSALDFKRDQYPFEGEDDKPKSELLKDLSPRQFANAWRRYDCIHTDRSGFVSQGQDCI